MGLGLDSAFEEGFGLLGRSVLKAQDRAQEEALLERKMQLQKQIEMDLMKAKYDYMKQNPTYKHFATDLQGNIVAFDMFGKPSVVYQSSPEERTLRLRKAEAEASSKEGTAAKDAAQTHEAEAHAANLEEHTAHPERFMRPAGAGKSVQNPFAKTPAEMDKLVRADALAAAGGDTFSWSLKKPEEQQAYMDAARKKRESQGYFEIKPGMTKQMPAGGLAAPMGGGDDSGAGVFTHLIPQGDDGTGDDEEDDGTEGYDPTAD